MPQLLVIRWRDANPKSEFLAGYSVHRDEESAQAFVQEQSSNPKIRAALRDDKSVGARHINVTAASPLLAAIQKNDEKNAWVSVSRGTITPELKSLHGIFKSAGSEHNLPIVRIPNAPTKKIARKQTTSALLQK